MHNAACFLLPALAMYLDLSGDADTWPPRPAATSEDIMPGRGPPAARMDPGLAVGGAKPEPAAGRDITGDTMGAADAMGRIMAPDDIGAELDTADWAAKSRRTCWVRWNEHRQDG